MKNMRPSKLIVAAVLAGLIAPSTNLRAENLPESRPALIGSGPNSLVNLINTDELFRKGQRDAWVMFECIILDDGIADSYDFAYSLSKSEGAEAWRAALRNALSRS